MADPDLLVRGAVGVGYCGGDGKRGKRRGAGYVYGELLGVSGRLHWADCVDLDLRDMLGEWDVDLQWRHTDCWGTNSVGELYLQWGSGDGAIFAQRLRIWVYGCAYGYGLRGIECDGDAE